METWALDTGKQVQWKFLVDVAGHEAAEAIPVIGERGVEVNLGSWEPLVKTTLRLHSSKLTVQDLCALATIGFNIPEKDAKACTKVQLVRALALKVADEDFADMVCQSLSQAKKSEDDDDTGEASLTAELHQLLETLRPEEDLHRRLGTGLTAKESALAEDQQMVQELLDAKVAMQQRNRCKQEFHGKLQELRGIERQQQQERQQVLEENVPCARRLHNSYLNLKGNIRVFCRFRPRLRHETEEAKVAFHDEQRITLQSEMLKSVTGLSEHCNSYDFHFDQVFGPQASQSEIFEELSLLVQSALDGYKVAIFAYGQTGGGKTYTMDGDHSEQMTGDLCRAGAGVIPRSVDLIFQEVEELRSKGWDFELTCTLLEVYNEFVFDVLAPRESKERSAHGTDSRQAVEQFTTRRVQEASQLHRLLAKAARERHTASTACNDRSSRSHALFQLALEGTQANSSARCSGLLSFVDLAGSERVVASQVQGERLREAQYINRSLSALGDVIEALKRKKSGGHVPYRNSRLTMLLKDSLGGDAKALMFVNVSMCLGHLPETLSSLRFASKVHACEVGLPSRRFAA
eukprot:s3122_g5.t1